MRFLAVLILICFSLHSDGQQVARYAYVMATAEPADIKVCTSVFPIDIFVKDFDGSYKKQEELKIKLCQILEKKAIDSVPQCTFITYCALLVHNDYFTGKDVVFTTEQAAQDDQNQYIELYRLNNKKLPVLQVK